MSSHDLYLMTRIGWLHKTYIYTRYTRHVKRVPQSHTSRFAINLCRPPTTTSQAHSHNPPATCLTDIWDPPYPPQQFSIATAISFLSFSLTVRRGSFASSTTDQWVPPRRWSFQGASSARRRDDPVGAHDVGGDQPGPHRTPRRGLLVAPSQATVRRGVLPAPALRAARAVARCGVAPCRGGHPRRRGARWRRLHPHLRIQVGRPLPRPPHPLYSYVLPLCCPFPPIGSVPLLIGVRVRYSGGAASGCSRRPRCSGSACSCRWTSSVTSCGRSTSPTCLTNPSIYSASPTSRTVPASEDFQLLLNSMHIWGFLEGFCPVS